jgi:hypothetical protein
MGTRTWIASASVVDMHNRSDRDLHAKLSGICQSHNEIGGKTVACLEEVMSRKWGKRVTSMPISE